MRAFGVETPAAAAAAAVARVIVAAHQLVHGSRGDIKDVARYGAPPPGALCKDILYHRALGAANVNRVRSALLDVRIQDALTLSCLPIANIVFSLLLVGGEHVVVVHCPLSKLLVGHHDLAVCVLLGTTTIGEHTLRFLVEAHHVVHP